MPETIRLRGLPIQQAWPGVDMIAATALHPEGIVIAPGRCFLLYVAAFAFLAGSGAHAQPPAERRPAPDEIRLSVSALQRILVFAVPAYLSTSAEDTPYQRLQLCDEDAKSCRTLLDARGSGGVAMPADKSLGLSPDGRYLLCVRMTGIDVPGKTYRGQYYQLYDLAAGKAVTFNTSAGRTATTDNIQGWSADLPHALEVSTTSGKTALAFPPGED